MASHRFLRFKEKRDTAAGLQEEDDPSPAPWQQCRSWHQWHHSVRSPSAWWGGFPGEENLDKYNWQGTNYAVIGCVDDYWLSDCEYPRLHCTVCNYKVWIGKSSFQIHAILSAILLEVQTKTTGGAFLSMQRRYGVHTYLFFAVHMSTFHPITFLCFSQVLKRRGSLLYLTDFFKISTTFPNIWETRLGET